LRGQVRGAPGGGNGSGESKAACAHRNLLGGDNPLTDVGRGVGRSVRLEPDR
jgi:hypothetical protein